MTRHIRGGHVAVGPKSFQTEVTDRDIDRAQLNPGEKRFCQVCGWWVPKTKWSVHRDHADIPDSMRNPAYKCPEEKGHTDPFAKPLTDDYQREVSKTASDNTRHIREAGAHGKKVLESHKLLDSMR